MWVSWLRRRGCDEQLHCWLYFDHIEICKKMISFRANTRSSASYKVPFFCLFFIINLYLSFRSSNGKSTKIVRIGIFSPSLDKKKGTTGQNYIERETRSFGAATSGRTIPPPPLLLPRHTYDFPLTPPIKYLSLEVCKFCAAKAPRPSSLTVSFSEKYGAQE